MKTSPVSLPPKISTLMSIGLVGISWYLKPFRNHNLSKFYVRHQISIFLEYPFSYTQDVDHLEKCPAPRFDSKLQTGLEINVRKKSNVTNLALPELLVPPKVKPGCETQPLMLKTISGTYHSPYAPIKRIQSLLYPK